MRAAVSSVEVRDKLLMMVLRIVTKHIFYEHQDLVVVPKIEMLWVREPKRVSGDAERI